MHRRQVIILIALIVGVIFLAGLFVHNRIGGVLLLVTAAILTGVTSAVWSRVPSKGRPLRILIIAAIAVGGVIKLIIG